MDRPYGRGLALVGWCIVAAGILMVLASAVSSDRWNGTLQVAGMVLFAIGGSGFVASQLRS